MKNVNTFLKIIWLYIKTCLLFHAEFGTVLELRINSGGKLPNFGFVVFDDSEPVQKILSSRVRFFFFFFTLYSV